MKKFIVSLIVMIVFILIPFVGVFTYGEKIQKQIYQESYYAELSEKRELLNKTKGPKIVFIGGSSLSFGLRSDEMEKVLNRPVINFGLYADLGTKVMLDLAFDDIKNGDVVVLAPEIDYQTYSLFMNYNTLLKCLENDNKFTNRLSIKDNLQLFYHYFDYVLERNNGAYISEEPYSKSSFNEYGDIVSDKVINNILPSYYDTKNIIKPSKNLIDQEFINYINSYNKRIKKKGAEMLFTFSPTNQLSLDDSNIDEFQSYLEEKLNFSILGNVIDFTYNSHYFYDTNYHLNYTGSLLHSKNLSDYLADYLNIEPDYEIEVPPMPSPKYDSMENIESDSYLLMNKLVTGSKEEYVVVGIKDEYKDKIYNLEIPSVFNGINVTTINDEAFANMVNLESITLPNTINNLVGSPFTNCPNLTRIVLKSDYVPNVSLTGFVEGTNPHVLIYVKSEIFSKYLNGYQWTNYRSKLRPL